MAQNKRQHFVEAVMEQSGVDRATIEHVVPVVFDVIRQQLCQGERVRIANFGVFFPLKLKERTVINNTGHTPRTHVLPAEWRPRFRPADTFTAELRARLYDADRTSFHRTGEPNLPHLRGRKKQDEK